MGSGISTFEFDAAATKINASMPEPASHHSCFNAIVNTVA
jgi:hypothetical protein